MKDKKRILFINLAAFSLTGGIEKFNKCFLKTLWELKQAGNLEVESFSLYDEKANESYFPDYIYKGFNQHKISFVKECTIRARNFDVIVLGHINLAIVGILIKLFYPRKKVILITHGIEVWQPLKGIQKSFLHKADKVFAVSNFTKEKLHTVQKLDNNKICIFPNTIDPFFNIPVNFDKPEYLKNRYGVVEDHFVLFTLTRLSSVEKYKGYDVVINCLPDLVKKIPNIKYIIAGKYDDEEKLRLEKMINDLGLINVVQLTGFLKEDEICDHYQLGDIFVMPSQGEGFGIVFIEAAVCGSKIIAGNKDGSVDALKNGELGLLVDPVSTKEISNAVLKLHSEKSSWDHVYKKDLQDRTLNYFGFNVFKNKLQKELMEI